jgi:AcrR family transcriptional regulator
VTTPRAYGGRTLDQRRDARREQLIETGLDCLQDEGLSGISVRSVCARAPLTPRYFYESFANLDELLVALVDHVGDQVLEAGTSSFDATLPLADRTRNGIVAVYDVIRRDARHASVLLASAAHPAMYARQQLRFLEYTEVLLDQLFETAEPLDRDRLRPMSLFLIGGTVELISARTSGLMTVSDDDLIDSCVTMFVAGWQAAGLPVVS